MQDVAARIRRCLFMCFILSPKLSGEQIIKNFPLNLILSHQLNDTADSFLVELLNLRDETILK